MCTGIQNVCVLHASTIFDEESCENYLDSVDNFWTVIWVSCAELCIFAQKWVHNETSCANFASEGDFTTSGKGLSIYHVTGRGVPPF